MKEKIYDGVEIDAENLKEISEKIVNDKERAFAFYDKLRAMFPEKDDDITATESGSLKDFLFLLPDFFVLILRLFLDKRVPKHKKVFLSCLIGYVVLPFDILPDFIPALGYLDDFVVVVLGLDIVLTDIRRRVIYDNWSGKQNVLEVIRMLVIQIENNFYKPMFKAVKNLLKTFEKKQ